MAVHSDGASELNQVEQVLHGIGASPRQAIEAMAIGVYAMDAAGRLLWHNEEAAKLWGRRPEIELGRPSEKFCASLRMYRLDGEELAHEDGPAAEVLKSGKPVRGAEIIFERPDGAKIPVLLSSSPIRDDQGALIGVVNCMIDIKERRDMEEALRDSGRTAEAERRADQLQRMAAEMTDAEQRERKHLAQVLHDDLQQLLVAARMQVSSATGVVDGDQAARASELLTQAIEASRSLSKELAPPVLYDLGLGSALEWLARRAAQRFDLYVEVKTEEEIEVRDERLRLALFEAVKELLLNVVKHADVERAQVTLRSADGKLELEVEDAGCGFDPQLARREETEKGLGLFSLEQRLTLLGCKMEIDSAPGAGTRVRIEVPAEPEGVLVSGEVKISTFENPPPKEKDEAAISYMGGRGERVRVLLAEDHEVVRRGLANLIGDDPLLELVGEAENGEAAITLAHETHPDVMVMDISLPGISGIEATRQVTREAPDIRIIAFSMHEEQDVTEALRDAGAVAFVSKSEPSEKLLRIIRDVGRRSA